MKQLLSTLRFVAVAGRVPVIHFWQEQGLVQSAWTITERFLWREVRKWLVTAMIALSVLQGTAIRAEEQRIVAVMFNGYMEGFLTDVFTLGFGRTGMEQLDRKVARALAGTGYSYESSIYECTVDLQEPMDFINSRPPHQLVLIGYSMGGKAVTSLSWELFNDNFPTAQDDFAVTIDPVIGQYGMAQLAPDFSGNPTRGRNYFETNDKSIVGLLVNPQIGGAISMDVGQAFDDSSIVHTNIHKDGRVHALIIRELLASLAHISTQTRSWTCSSPASDWNVPANWSPAGVPRCRVLSVP